MIYLVSTFRYFGVGMRINNYQHANSDESRAAREEIAIRECEEYAPALVEGYRKLMAPGHLNQWSNYEVKDEWKPIV